MRREKYTSAELTQKCIDRDLIINNCERKRLTENRNLIRPAIRDRKDNAKLIEILKES